jgi:hypothetical protein
MREVLGIQARIVAKLLIGQFHHCLCGDLSDTMSSEEILQYTFK